MLSFLKSKVSRINSNSHADRAFYTASVICLQGEKLLTACNDGDIKTVALILKTATAVDINYTNKVGDHCLGGPLKC